MAAGVSLLSDLPYSSSGAYSGELNIEMEPGNTTLILKYLSIHIIDVLCYITLDALLNINKS